MYEIFKALKFYVKFIEVHSQFSRPLHLLETYSSRKKLILNIICKNHYSMHHILIIKNHHIKSYNLRPSTNLTKLNYSSKYITTKAAYTNILFEASNKNSLKGAWGYKKNVIFNFNFSSKAETNRILLTERCAKVIDLEPFTFHIVAAKLYPPFFPFQFV
jgi:hypothetical protein